MLQELQTRRRGQTVSTGSSVSSRIETRTSSRVVTSTSTSVSNVLRSRGAEVFMRSRNVHVNATNLKPRTRYYQFLDSTSGVDFMPKMLEVSVDSGLKLLAQVLDLVSEKLLLEQSMVKKLLNLE